MDKTNNTAALAANLFAQIEIAIRLERACPVCLASPGRRCVTPTKAAYHSER